MSLGASRIPNGTHAVPSDFLKFFSTNLSVEFSIKADTSISSSLLFYSSFSKTILLQYTSNYPFYVIVPLSHIFNHVWLKYLKEQLQIIETALEI